MSALLLYPGEVGDLLDVNEVLRQRHEEVRVAVELAIEQRKVTGAPLDDATDWAKVSVDAQSLVSSVGAKDTQAVRTSAQAVLDQTSGGLAPVPAYEPDEKLDGVRVQCVVLSERRRRALAAKERSSLDALRLAVGKGYEAEVEATDALFAARRDFVRESVVRIDVGDTVLSPVDEKALDALERSHLLNAIYSAAMANQDLSPGKLKRSGSSAAPTSGASSVPSAPSIDAAAAGVTVDSSMSMASQQSTQAPGTQLIPALGGI